MSGIGPAAVDLAARIDDGCWGTSPDRDPLARYRDAGGVGPRYGQMTACVGANAQECRETVHRYPEAGYDHVYFHQIGPDQDAFFQMWAEELQPDLARSVGRSGTRSAA